MWQVGCSGCEPDSPSEADTWVEWGVDLIEILLQKSIHSREFIEKRLGSFRCPETLWDSLCLSRDITMSACTRASVYVRSSELACLDMAGAHVCVLRFI